MTKDTKDKINILLPSLLGGHIAKGTTTSFMAIPFINNINDLTSKTYSSDNLKKNEDLLSYFNKKYKNTVYVDPELKTSGAAYNSIFNSVYFDDFKHPGELAHELGHANYYKNNRYLKSIAHLVNKPIGYATGAAMLTNDDTRPYAAAPVAISHLPKLYDEANASRTGLKLLKEMGYSAEELLKAKKLYRNAFGTYGAAALGSTAGMGLASYIYTKIKNKNDKIGKTNNG